jgi:hypothetical protein
MGTSVSPWLKGEVRVMPMTDFVEERFYTPCTQYLAWEFVRTSTR